MTQTESQGPLDKWEPVSGTRFYTRNGSGLYERLTDRLFLRVDTDEDAEKLLERIDRRLDEAHALADRLLPRSA